MKRLLPILIVILTVSLLYAFRKKEIDVEIIGTVFYKDAPLESVEVAVLKDGLDNWKPARSHEGTYYYQHSSYDGSFSLEFNAYESRKIYLFLHKEGYTPLLVEYMPVITRKNFDLGELTLLKMQPGAGRSNFPSKEGQPKSTRAESFKLFDDQNLSSHRMIHFEHIEYFTSIERVQNILPSSHVSTYHVSFYQKGSTLPESGYLFQ